MSETIFKEGDVFRWAYKPEHLPNKEYRMAYWCKSCTAIYKNGSLGDTYWGNDDLRFVRPEEVDLTFIGNLDDFERVDDWRAPLYAVADIMDLRHSNNSHTPLLLRKGAKRSPEAAIQHCRDKIEREQSTKRSAENAIERLEGVIKDIEAGKIDEVYL